MCLSTVFCETAGEKELLFKNIAKVERSGDKLVFTDIMGIRREIMGSIRDIDLLENCIHVTQEVRA